MSQSRFSIVLVGVSALLRRPLVSRLRPAGFTARGSGGFRRSGWPLRFGLPLGGWPSGSLLPFFGMRRFGVAAGRIGSSAFRFGDSARRVGFRAHRFHFSARTDSGLPSAGWFFHLPFRRFRSASWPSGSLLPLFGMHRFGDCPRRVDSSAQRVGLRVHRFRFSARTDPHRRTAEARADGAHRHDTCFTSKHLSQHVNLPHRTP